MTFGLIKTQMQKRLVAWYNFFENSYLLLLFSCPVMSNSLWPHKLQHTRPSCPSASPKVCPSSCPFYWWRPFSRRILAYPLLHLPSTFPSIRVLSNESLFASGDQNTGASASASVLSMSIQGWFSLRFTGLISLLSKGFSGVFSSTRVQRHQFFSALPS